MNTTPKTPLGVDHLQALSDAYIALGTALTDAAETLLPEEPDERIAAWEEIAAHPAFRRCYKDGRLLDAMLETLDGTVVEPETTPAPVALPTVDEVALAAFAGYSPLLPWAYAGDVTRGRFMDAARTVLDLIAARVPVWVPVERMAPGSVRVGDRVRVAWADDEATVTDIEGGDVALLTVDGSILWASLTGDRHDRAALYLIERPAEPDDPAVQLLLDWYASKVTPTNEDAALLLARLDAVRAES